MEEVAHRVKERAVVWAIDVAKVEYWWIVSAAGGSHGEVGAPGRDTALLERLRGLACGSLTAVMESTVAGTLQPLMKRAGR